MTQQEIFDTVVAALLKQGCRSQDGTGFCMFRDHTGNKCAVGHLIPDEEYNPLFDVTVGQNGFGNSGTLDLYAEKLSVPFQFLRDLQKCHDGADDLHFDYTFRAKAEAFANRYALNAAVLAAAA